MDCALVNYTVLLPTSNLKESTIKNLMQRTTQAEIAEMRARGYDPILIQEAKYSQDRTRTAERQCAQIAEAFAGVKLGSGIGLRQAKAIDDYEDRSVQMARRAEDEKEDWSAITIDDLNRFSSSLSFFDGDGMRFHLPAFLIADLKGVYHMGLKFTLTHLSDYDRNRFAHLTLEQSTAIADYLCFIRENCYGSDRKEIDHALVSYWRSESPATCLPCSEPNSKQNQAEHTER